MRIALAQFGLQAHMHSNLAKGLELLSAASQRGAQVVVYPELCLSPFFPQFAGRDASAYALEIGDDAIKQFQGACRRMRLIAIPNLYLQELSRRFDASLVINANGEVQGISKMVHIAQLPGFFEQDYYAPSNTGFRVYDTPVARIGIVVCFDRHFPESIRTCAVLGADLIVIPTANTTEEPRDLFECELQTAAFQNGVFIAMCNRVGQEGGITFCGESTVVGPEGRVIVKAGHEEDLIIAEVDLKELELARRRRPYLTLRRPETYK